ncbi:allergen [Plectosphaerella plurivora]|uniref:Allergen n=1 Tax=Plectosphaerella plurivora TaxID=936078 RepID=A0A9P8V430_9PEZI|nr:allergen [Plectosphaerella plurivora]
MSTVNKSTTHHRTSIGTSSSGSTADVTDQEIVKFVSHDGEHHTTVDESVFKVVTDEHIRTYQHEEITHALDKEIHEDHHYTVVQPIETTENLMTPPNMPSPDKHTHNLVSIEHRTIDQRNKQAIRDQLAAEAARFKNTTVTHEATRSSYTGPEITSEHVHHHIHEHIQPVLHKEVLAHEYIHTTIPVHETHHVEAQHHGTTILPSITLEEFRSKKGIWNGRKERRVSEYDGCPETYEKKLHEERAKLGEATMTAQVV